MTLTPYYDHAGITIYHGDCREILPHVKADVVVTDPPYGIGYVQGGGKGSAGRSAFVGIPVTGDDSFVFQFEGQESYVLETGKAYNWDTYKSHRVMCVKDTEMYRANMVIGLSPWLTYNKEERYWYANEYFGKKHPFDIFIEGRVTDKIEFLKAW